MNHGTVAQPYLQVMGLKPDIFHNTLSAYCYLSSELFVHVIYSLELNSSVA